MEGIGVHGVGDQAGGESTSLAEAHKELGLLGHQLRSPLSAGGVRYIRTPTHDSAGAAGLEEGEDEDGLGLRGPSKSDITANSLEPLTSDEYRLKYNTHVHRMPHDPKPLDYAMYVPKAMRMFFVRLTDAFGFKFIAMIVAVYGMSQGFGELYMSMSIDYFLKDDLKLQPADAQVFKSMSHLPWNIKPIYGLISDTVPIMGYQRGPYIVIAGALGMFAYLFLCLGKHMTFNLAAFLVTLANYSIASPDVIIDAAVTERSQYAPMYASDLQSLSWGAHAVGGILGCLSVGKAQMSIKARGIFGLTAFTSLLVFVLAGLKWLPENRLPPSQRRVRCDFGGQRRLYMLAMFVALAAVFVAVGVANIKNKDVAGAVTMTVGITVTAAVYRVLSQISPKIAKPAVFFFLREAFAPSIGQLMFYWYTSAPEGPQFQPDFLGNLSCIASVSMIVGIVLYNKYMSSWKYRTIFAASQLLSFGTGMLDYVIVARLNIKAGISDKAFVLGDEAITPMLRKIAAMPFFVLCSKVCPEKCEATLFALLMALSNFGGDLGSYLGVWMVKAFDVTKSDYSRLPELVVAKTFLRLLPIIFIPFLLPDASPADEILSKEEKELSSDVPTPHTGGRGAKATDGVDGELELRDYRASRDGPQVLAAEGARLE